MASPGWPGAWSGRWLVDGVVSALSGAELSDAVALLYDAALIAEGSPVTDGARFTKLLSDLMLGSAR